jgi:hypothetical protein
VEVGSGAINLKDPVHFMGVMVCVMIINIIRSC